MESRYFIPERVRDTSFTIGDGPRTSAHLKRIDLFDRYWRYYRGNHRQPLKVAPDAAIDDNVIINWSRKIVNLGIQFLFGPAIRFDIGGDGQTSPAEDYLNGFWSVDPIRGWSPAAFFQALGQNGAITGTPFIRLSVDPDGRPKLRAIDPAIVDIETDPDDVEQVVAYHLTWKSADDWKRQTYRDAGGIWTIEDAIWKVGRWSAVEEREWGFDFAPLFHAQNLVLANSVWGLSDLEDADLNDAINFTASNINRVLRFHAHPKTVITGLPKTASDELKTSPDGVWRFSSADTRAFNLEMQSDLASSRQHQDDLTEDFHQIAGVPRLDPATVNVGALSGFALRILYGPLLAKTAVKQATYGTMLAQVNRALLLLAGFDDEPVATVWGNPLPVSELEMAQHAKLLTEAGASLDGALYTARYSPDQIQRMVRGDLPNGIEL